MQKEEFITDGNKKRRAVQSSYPSSYQAVY